MKTPSSVVFVFLLFKETGVKLMEKKVPLPDLSFIVELGFYSRRFLTRSLLFQSVLLPVNVYVVSV